MEEIKTDGFYDRENDRKHIFIPPAPTETERGGITAKTRTTENTEVAVDPETGKAYVPELPGTDDLSKEATAEQILAKLQEVIPLINQIAQSGTAGSVNGFSFAHGDDGSVMITYTPDGATEAEVAVFPKETTQKKISKATKEIADSLKIIAGKEDKA